jgi:hypothetical protein
MADNFEPVKFNPEEKPEEKKGVMGSGGQIDLKALANMDPELSKLCSELDLDGDGTINAAELTRACGVIRETRDESAEWQKAAFRRLIAIVVLLAVNLALIGTVTYYIVWSTAAVRVDENGNLVNFHEDGEESAPSPVAAQTAMEEKDGLDVLFESADYNNIDMLGYNNANGAQFVRPQGFSVFEKEIEGAAHDVVVVYVDGTTAIVVENKIADPYVISPSTPYTISTDVAFGEVNADNLVRPSSLRKLSESNNQVRQLKGKGKNAKESAQKSKAKVVSPKAKNEKGAKAAKKGQ